MDLHLVFRDFPGPGDECVFVEGETPGGKSVNAGEWRSRDDGFVELVVPDAINHWSPIETAPRDGTAILVWGGTYLSDSVWYDDGKQPQDVVECVRWYNNGWCIGNDQAHNEYQWVKNPTHWRDVPAPPEVAA